MKDFTPNNNELTSNLYSFDEKISLNFLLWSYQVNSFPFFSFFISSSNHESACVERWTHFPSLCLPSNSMGICVLTWSLRDMFSSFVKSNEWNRDWQKERGSGRQRQRRWARGVVQWRRLWCGENGDSR